ncbi:MAG TPA: PDR/VanB family oxidoreductase [Acetobacteraceae bacterium]|nr:PDR/VanB family oxidoreductase [Acetobacteraceae bacterium]
MSQDETELITVRVARTEPEADGIQLFELRDPAGRDLPPFTPGAHLSVRVPNGSMRNYSIASDPADTDHYLIAVKREVEGRGGSISLIEQTKPGDLLQVSQPRNLFELAANAPSYIFVAGGIGITPILSMIHHVRANGEKPFKLYYLTRSAAVTAFLPALADPALKGRVVIHHDQGDPDKTFDLWPVFENPTRAHIYCCGPRPLMDAVRDMTGHWPASQVHFEDFGSDLVRPRADDVPFTVRLAKSGATLEVPVGVTIMEVMRRHGLRVPSSCESGTCGTCRTRLLEGEPDHRDLVLTEAERRTEILVCVSRAKSPELTLDA